MPHGELIYVSNDDHGKLVALLDGRRKMLTRHARKRASRCQGTLAEKLADRSKQKEELDELNTRIDALMQVTGGAA
jgi:hypothetical protein